MFPHFAGTQTEWCVRRRRTFTSLENDQANGRTKGIVGGKKEGRKGRREGGKEGLILGIDFGGECLRISRMGMPTFDGGTVLRKEGRKGGRDLDVGTKTYSHISK